MTSVAGSPVCGRCGQPADAPLCPACLARAVDAEPPAAPSKEQP